MTTSTTIPDVTLLLQDLLSPSTTLLPSTTPSLISYHLATLSLDSPTSSLLSDLITYLVLSPSLWRGAAQPSEAEGGGWPPLDSGRAREVYNALVQGWLYRAGEVTNALGTGWRARRRFASFLQLYFEGLHAAASEGPSRAPHPLIRVLVASAGLTSLQSIKMKREKLYVGGSALMGRAEGEVLDGWTEWATVEERDRRGSRGMGAPLEWSAGREGGDFEMMRVRQDPTELPAWLASQTLPQFPVDSLAQGPVARLLHLLSLAHSSTFASGHLFTTLPSSLTPTPDGLRWTHPSDSHTLLTSLVNHPTFLSLGLISRALGRLIEAAGVRAKSAAPGDPSTLIAVRNFGTALERTAARVQRGWKDTTWSDIEHEGQLTPATRDRKEPWTLMKSLLFSITLIDSSLLHIVSPKRGVPPTELQLELAKQALRTLGKTYFITIKFGSDGFEAWKGAWAGLMEVVGQDPRPRALERFMEELEPNQLGTTHERTVERSEATFYLNAAEQLMKQLGEDYVEDRVLKCCHPYLETTTYRDTFESAHSVLLAVFATQKRCANDLAPWYTRLLLSAYPHLMSASQLRLAFTTIVRCVSATDDALAWYCISQLIEAIRALPSSSSTSSPSSSSTAPALGPSTSTFPSPSSTTTTTTTSRDFDSEATSTRLDESSSLSPLEQRALTLQRGHLLLTLIDQTTAVNLILLRKLLDEIWEFVKQESGGASAPAGIGSEGQEEESPKEALVKVVFGTLGEGLDATKRKEGVRYWLEHGEELAGP